MVEVFLIHTSIKQYGIIFCYSHQYKATMVVILLFPPFVHSFLVLFQSIKIFIHTAPWKYYARV